MKVWLLFDCSEHEVEGVYTEVGKRQKDEQLFDEARQLLEATNAQRASVITELKKLRRPFISTAETLLVDENAAKSAGDVTLAKSIRKQRKDALRKAERLTYDIANLEESILASKRMTRAEIFGKYGRRYYWEDFDLAVD